MKFAHMADCHIGSWSDPKLRELSTKAFQRAIDICIDKKVEFILISGDLFHTALPAIESLKAAVEKLKQAKDNNINVYVLAGSHDYSPSGKTILEVLDKAGIITDITNKKTFAVQGRAKITGIHGRRGSLEKQEYDKLNKQELENASGFKIFMFHSAISEIQMSGLDMIEKLSIKQFPKNFDYYAGGHVHQIIEKNIPDYGKIIYPGPTFPDTFKELEELKQGGFYIIEKNPETNLQTEYIPLNMCSVFSINMDCNQKTSEEVNAQLKELVSQKEFIHTIVTIRLFGELKTGKTSDINFRSLRNNLETKGAISILRNTSKLSSKEFKAVKVAQGSVDEVENMIIKENSDQINVEDWDQQTQQQKIVELMQILSQQRADGERVVDFEKRITKQAMQILK